MEQNVTTIEELMPHLRADMTAKELGAVVIALVPPIYGMRIRLARLARDRLERTWTENVLRGWLSPGNHSDERTLSNLEAVRVAAKRWRADPQNAERHREMSLRWKAENLDRYREKAKCWRAVNSERVRETNRRWKAENPERLQELNQESKQRRRIENPNQYRDYIRKRRKADPVFRMVQGLRCRLRDALKGKNKSAATMELIGCSIEELRGHLERQFTEGMTWENYGSWHCDHLVPCAAFDLSDPDQQRECFHWSNLQPLWATENSSKGSLHDGVRHRHGSRSGARRPDASPDA